MEARVLAAALFKPCKAITASEKTGYSFGVITIVEPQLRSGELNKYQEERKR